MMKTLKFKLMTIISVMVIILITVSTLVLYNQAQSILKERIFDDAVSKTNSDAKTIKTWFEGLLSKGYALAKMDHIKTMDWEKQEANIKSMEEDSSDLENIFISNIDGSYHAEDGSTGSVAGRDYFNEVIESKSYTVSKPITSKVTGNQVVVLAIPIKEKHKIIGVLGMTVNLDFLQEMIQDIKIAEHGYGWIIDKEYRVLAHSEDKYLGKNDIFDKNIDLKKIAAQMASGKAGVDFYNYQGVEKGVAFAPIGIKGWSIAVSANSGDVLAPLSVIKVRSWWIGVAAVFIGIIIAVLIALYISKPVVRISEITETVAAGRLDQQIKINDFRASKDDELGVLILSIDKMLTNVRQTVKNIYTISEQLAASSQQLSAAGDQIGETAEEVGSSIQNVATGAEEQSASVETVSENIKKMIKRIQTMSMDFRQIIDASNNVIKNVNKGNDSVEYTIEQINKVKEDTTKTSKAIQNLGVISEEIGSIVDLINGISDQTNLLALNAAIEAARAGEAGRGFSVVAEEIRDLAEESSQATAEIDKLIKKIETGVKEAVKSLDVRVNNVNNSVQAVYDTEKVFEKIEVVSNKLRETINKSADKAKTTADSSKKIEEETDSIAAVSEEFAANSEEVAAASEEQLAATEEIVTGANELASMADELVNTVSKFKL
ncbi:MAG: methyl-accepting chemotaxis protein [Halothermotrichaceae bacterium]